MTEKDIEIQRIRQELEQVKLDDEVIDKYNEAKEKWYVYEYNELLIELKKTQRERDAAIAEVNKYRSCGCCKHNKGRWNEFCLKCDNDLKTLRPNFEWRGVKETAK